MIDKGANISYLMTFLMSGVIIVSCHTPQMQEASSYSEPVSVYFEEELKPFFHGVASGDPSQESIIIWTRITPEDPATEVEVKWEISEHREFTEATKSGTFTTSPERDYTVKVDVTGLNPGTLYYYRFSGLGGTSITGRTKTAPTHADSLRFAVVSCANYEYGFFSAYRKIAEQEILDAVIHLGDYIYEYAPGIYGDTALNRVHLPAKELIELKDYRTRYSQYRLDPDLRLAHSAQPFITIWDDHEIANNAYATGAQNHQENEGSYEARKQAAVKAYYEWMPVRESNGLYRAFSFGKLADLIMLDERLAGRTKQPDSLKDPAYSSEQSAILGTEQMDWAKEQLQNSDAKWKIIGNQVIFSDLYRGAIFPEQPKNMDSWDGYPEEKKQIAGFIRKNDISNVVFVTGDTHSSWAFETVVSNVSPDPVAVEFGTTSISSPNYDEKASLEKVRKVEKLFLETNSHLKYTNLVDHGYLLLSLKDEEATARFYFMETLKTPESDENMSKKFTVKAGQAIVN